MRFVLDVYDTIQSWIALAVVGILSGVVAAMVAMGTDWANDSKFGTCMGRGFWITRQMCCKDSADLLQCPNWRSWGELAGGSSPESIQLISYFFYVVIASCQAGYSAWLCKTFAPYAVGSGIGEIKVIMSGFVIKRFLGGWTLLIKSLGLILSVGSGMAIGKEGPFIHLSCCIANVVSRMFSKYSTNEGKKRELLSCAAAAGVAVAFGAPIGGVLFSLEEVTTYFPAKAMWRSLFCAVLAAMALQRMNPLNQSGKLVLFEVRCRPTSFHVSLRGGLPRCGTWPVIHSLLPPAIVFRGGGTRTYLAALGILPWAMPLSKCMQVDVAARGWSCNHSDAPLRQRAAACPPILRSRTTINGSSSRWLRLC